MTEIKNVSVRLELDQYKEIEAAAKKEYMSVSGFIRKAALQKVEEFKEE